MHVQKRLALPRASHFGETAMSGTHRLRSTRKICSFRPVCASCYRSSLCKFFITARACLHVFTNAFSCFVWIGLFFGQTSTGNISLLSGMQVSYALSLGIHDLSLRPLSTINITHEQANSENALHLSFAALFPTVCSVAMKQSSVRRLLLFFTSVGVADVQCYPVSLL